MIEQTTSPKDQRPNKIHQILIFVTVFSYLVISALGSIGLYKVINFDLGLILTGTLCLISFGCVVQRPIPKKQIVILAIVSLLFIQSLMNSSYLAFSAVLAFYFATSAALLVTLQQSRFLTPTSNYRDTALLGAKYAFILFAVLHSITLVFFYLFEPNRTTGLLDDYSQASMILLLALGLAYPLWKENRFFSAFALVLLIAYFTSYSRTANFLLVIFLLILFFVERRNDSINSTLKLSLLAGLAYFFVALYPELVGKEMVDRGGLAQFSTLNSRTIYWQTAWDAIIQKPWFGWGLRTYAWTGIQETQPFNIIYFVHNDYLQIWHDLGIFWLLLLLGSCAFILVKHLPVTISFQQPFSIAAKDQPLQKQIAWLLILTVAMYMCINFLITSFEFQIAIAIILTDLLDHD